MAKKKKAKKGKRSRKAREPLVVTSKVKAYIRASGAKCSGELPGALSDAVYELLDKAVARAQANRRTTLKPTDL